MTFPCLTGLVPLFDEKLTSENAVLREKWQIGGCVKFLYPAEKGCQAHVNFTLQPLLTGNLLKMPINKGLQKLNALQAFVTDERLFS